MRKMAQSTEFAGFCLSASGDKWPHIPDLILGQSQEINCRILL
ncbi:Hypothetical protein (plasmid) [Pseudomonas putida]|nr:Hypothetical protein [Pseudomonas putida]